MREDYIPPDSLNGSCVDYSHRFLFLLDKYSGHDLTPKWQDSDVIGEHVVPEMQNLVPASEEPWEPKTSPWRQPHLNWTLPWDQVPDISHLSFSYLSCLPPNAKSVPGKKWLRGGRVLGSSPRDCPLTNPHPTAKWCGGSGVGWIRRYQEGQLEEPVRSSCSLGALQGPAILTTLPCLACRVPVKGQNRIVIYNVCLFKEFLSYLLIHIRTPKVAHNIRNILYIKSNIYINMSN